MRSSASSCIACKKSSFGRDFTRSSLQASVLEQIVHLGLRQPPVEVETDPLVEKGINKSAMAWLTPYRAPPEKSACNTICLLVFVSPPLATRETSSYTSKGSMILLNTISRKGNRTQGCIIVVAMNDLFSARLTFTRSFDWLMKEQGTSIAESYDILR